MDTTKNTQMRVAIDRLFADLVDAQSATENDLQEFAQIAIRSYLRTPHIWPLDDRVHQALLAVCGVDLNDPLGLHTALLITGCLQRTGCAPIVCGHDRRTGPICARKDLRGYPGVFELADRTEGEIATHLERRDRHRF